MQSIDEDTVTRPPNPEFVNGESVPMRLIVSQLGISAIVQPGELYVIDVPNNINKFSVRWEPVADQPAIKEPINEQATR